VGVIIGLIALVVLAAVVVAVVASFFVRRHGESSRTDPGWQPTSEVFVDPTTARQMRVWVDPAGGRHYVPEGQGRPI
jgi:hypothetical protein